MKDYRLITDLTKGNFYSGGKIFVKLSPDNKADRELIFSKINANLNKNKTNKIDLESAKISENEFKSKMMNSFLDLSKNQNPATLENIKADSEKFLDQLLPTDIIVLLPSTGINSNELHELKSNCIIYFELSKNINLGFVIDKTFFNILANMGG